MSVIEEFIARYRKEYDFYDQAARLVAQVLDARLQSAGVRSIVTSRAKTIGRVEPKVRDRMERKGYQTVVQIYDDIVDLAGVRVALYFPAQRDQVAQIVHELFVLSEPEKKFPDKSSLPKYNKRFEGYSAIHFRARLRDSALSEGQKRYGEALVEIQVASVLMHAWAEVEHDLVYKPLQGALSQEEYMILDELNGLVMAGELALERLQNAGEARVASDARRFENHFELAAYVLRAARQIVNEPIEQAGLGRVDLLFDLISRLKLDTPKSLARYVSALHADVENRAVSEQLVDQILAEDQARYAVYDEVKALRRALPEHEAATVGSPSAEEDAATGYFLKQWIALETLIREATPRATGQTPALVPSVRALRDLGLHDGVLLIEFDRIRRLRNNVVHGIETADPADLRNAGDQLGELRKRLGSSKPLAALRRASGPKGAPPS